MEKIYTKRRKNEKQVKARPETIRFLLDYSRSLRIAKVDGVDYEHHMN